MSLDKTLPFRVHFEDGEKINVTAKDAAAFNKAALAKHVGIIRNIEPTPRGKPKSSAWFMKFQRETHLNECFSRPSPAYGRRREWSFFDIKLAWDAYYRRR